MLDDFEPPRKSWDDSPLGLSCPSCIHRDWVFVFGSNEAGIHGAGAAKHAREYHGATSGQPFGLMGKAFAIPTKDPGIKRRLILRDIEAYIRAFKRIAQSRQDLTFALTRIGCGLAGYEDKDIAPLFREAPENVILPASWVAYLELGNCGYEMPEYSYRLQSTGTESHYGKPKKSDENA